MEKSIDIKPYFPRFYGITNIKHGHLYEDEKGVEIIFVSFGNMADNWKEDNGIYRKSWCSEDSFLYIKKNKLMNAIHKELIINSNKFVNIVNQLMYSNKGELFEYFNFSKKPRKFVKDLGVYFPQDINPELFEFFESDKYEHDFDENREHININGSNCRFGSYWSFDFK